MGLLGFIQARVAEQWYLPAQEFTCDADDLKQGMKASLKERSGNFGTSLFLDLEVAGQPRQSVKVSGALAEQLREANAIGTAKVDVSTILITELHKTASAQGSVRDKIYRASFSWS